MVWEDRNTPDLQPAGKGGLFESVGVPDAGNQPNRSRREKIRKGSGIGNGEGAPPDRPQLDSNRLRFESGNRRPQETAPFFRNQNNPVGSTEGGNRFPKRPPRKQPPIPEPSGFVDQDQIEITVQLAMLETIIEEKQFDGGILLQGFEAGFVSIRADPNRSPLDRSGKQQGFVPHLRPMGFVRLHPPG